MSMELTQNVGNFSYLESGIKTKCEKNKTKQPKKTFFSLFLQQQKNTLV